MDFKRKTWLDVVLAWSVGLGSLALMGAAGATGTASSMAAVNTTPIVDTVYRANGATATGTVSISWPAFVTASAGNVPAGSTTVALGTTGTLSVRLVPNAGSTPMGSYYTVVYHLGDGSVTHEYWVVPASTSPVQVASLRSSVIPASVAMQTVSKSYVDRAVASAQAGTPVGPSPYVLKTGDTMSGPLVLPGDPVAPLQAADMAYVDAQVAGVTAGLGQKVSTQPQVTQTVTQPPGTQLHVNDLNGELYASQYQTGAGNNGIANATASPDCANGCQVVAEQTYASNEATVTAALPDKTHVEDRRGGTLNESFKNTLNPVTGGNTAGEAIDLVSTQSAPSVFAATGGTSSNIGALAVTISNQALAGGSNTYPRAIQGAVPYFKTTYSALGLKGVNNTVGQHVLAPEEQDCYGVGDCLMGSQFMLSSGGFRDDADEGAHPFDLQIVEDSRVFSGTCGNGCTTGATQLQVNVAANGGTQGEGRYLLNTNPAKVLTGTTLTGGGFDGRQAVATFAGTNFAVSTLLESAQTIPTQSNNIAPGTVTVPIVTTGAPTGFATNTAALPTPAGVACVADERISDTRPLNFETAAYTVVDASHLRLTLNRPHAAGATIAVGGLCGYGLEQTVDTLNGIRQVFPVIGSTSPTTLLYAGNQKTSLVGVQGLQSAFTNLSLVVASIARKGNVVTVTTPSNFPVDVTGLRLTVQGVADSSYNGTFAVTSTGPNSLTYAETGADSTSAGGTLTYLTGGYALYPEAEVLTVYNPATHAVDGLMALAANTVNWAAGDTVEEPHYFQEAVGADTEFITQYEPRPSFTQTAGLQYDGNNGPGLSGFTINNNVAATQYFGNGGTHTPPSAGIAVRGIWRDSLQVQAGEDAVMTVGCNQHGCDKWNSGYDLFQMATSAGVDRQSYSPATSTLNFSLRGTNYTFNPSGFTAGTINVGTLNATTVKGQFQGSIAPASLPLFGGSGASHAPGAVPDPGASAGATRFLREDGTWASTGASSSAVTTGVVTTSGPINLPQRAGLLGEYLMNEGAGAVAHDTSGNGNDGTLGGVNGGPQWEGTTDLDFNAIGQYVQLPVPLNGTRTWQFGFYNPPFGVNVSPQAPTVYRPDVMGANPAILCGTDAGHLCLTANSLTVGTATPKSWRFYASNTDHGEAADTLTAGWHVVTIICGNYNQPTGSPLYHILYDGTEVGGYRYQDKYSCPVNQPNGNYQLGGSSFYPGTWFVGKMAAVWAWGAQLSVSDAAAAARSGLAYMRAKGVPLEYRKVVRSAPVIVMGLDSRTAGTGTSIPWSSMISVSDASYTKKNMGVSGATAYDLCSQFDLTMGAQMSPDNGPSLLMLWGGVNDYNIRTPREIANSLRCVVTQARAAGARVVLATEISNNLPNGDSNKNALNTILRAEAFGWGVDNLADLATDVHLGADGASNNTACFPDNLHPGDNCEPYVTAIMSDAANEVLGSSERNRHSTVAASYAETAGDRFLDLTGTAAQTVTLPDCTGYSLRREVTNLGSAAATINVVTGQTLSGPGSVVSGARATFLPIPGALSTGGCHWERTE